MAYHPFFGTPFDDDAFAIPPIILPKFSTSVPKPSKEYDITEDDTQFQLSVDLPGVKAKDMTMELERDGQVLHLYGTRKKISGTNVTETKFDHRFTIGKNIDPDDMTANLSDGVLVVKAWKKKKTDKARVITITDHPSAETMKPEGTHQ